MDSGGEWGQERIHRIVERRSAGLGEPTQDDVERAFPNWATWRGVDRMCHARRTEGAAPWVRGEDWQDLLDQIRRAEAMLEDSRPAGWPR